MSEAVGTKSQQSSDECAGKETLEIEKVHSANSWETVELGDDDRKKKFLRLMGAGKKQHQGRFVIGDQDKSHGRSTGDTEALTSGLEKQFTDSLDHKFSGGPKSHIGLGFHEIKDKESSEKTEGREKEGREMEEKDKVEAPEQKQETDSTDNKNSITAKHKIEDNSTDDKPKSKVMKFVKASS